LQSHLTRLTFTLLPLILIEKNTKLYWFPVKAEELKNRPGKHDEHLAKTLVFYRNLLKTYGAVEYTVFDQIDQNSIPHFLPTLILQKFATNTLIPALDPFLKYPQEKSGKNPKNGDSKKADPPHIDVYPTENRQSPVIDDNTIAADGIDRIPKTTDDSDKIPKTTDDSDKIPKSSDDIAQIPTPVDTKVQPKIEQISIEMSGSDDDSNKTEDGKNTGFPKIKLTDWINVEKSGDPIDWLKDSLYDWTKEK